MRPCEEQLTEVCKKIHGKYITFTNNKQLLSDYPFPNVTCLIVDGDSTLAGIDKNRLSTGKHEVKVRYFPWYELIWYKLEPMNDEHDKET